MPELSQPARSIAHWATVVMSEKAIRRIPVVENEQPIGIVTIGDLAAQRDPDSALGQISQAAPNN